MATMPRKVLFYLIYGTPETAPVCLVLLETVARAKAPQEADTLHLSSRTGITITWHRRLTKGMYFMYFLFDCFGCYEPAPWDSHSYVSRQEKLENIRRLGEDGRWAICAFLRSLGAITQFTLVGLTERLKFLGNQAIAQNDLRIARELHTLLDDLFFHSEKNWLHIRLGRVMLEDRRCPLYGGRNEVEDFLRDCITSAEYRHERFSSVEKKIGNMIEMVRIYHHHL